MNGPLVLGAVGGLAVAAAAVPLYLIMTPGERPYYPGRDETYGSAETRARVEQFLLEMRRLLILEIAGAALLGSAVVWQASAA